MAKPSTGTKIYLSLIGLALAAAGGIFFALMWRSFERAREIDHWPVAPCVILSSETEERQIDPNGPVERRFSVAYSYDWEGKEYQGSHWKLRENAWSSQEDRVEDLLTRYPEGSTRQCHVNPADPKIAVLELESKAPGYSLWFPALFVVGGLGITVGAWRRK